MTARGYRVLEVRGSSAPGRMGDSRKRQRPRPGFPWCCHAEPPRCTRGLSTDDRERRASWEGGPSPGRARPAFGIRMGSPRVAPRGLPRRPCVGCSEAASEAVVDALRRGAFGPRREGESRDGGSPFRRGGETPGGLSRLGGGASRPTFDLARRGFGGRSPPLHILPEPARLATLPPGNSLWHGDCFAHSLVSSCLGISGGRAGGRACFVCSELYTRACLPCSLVEVRGGAITDLRAVSRPILMLQARPGGRL